MSDELTPEIRARRVAVAKDVIARIEMRNLSLLSCNGYVVVEGDIGDDILDLSRNGGDLMPVVDRVERACTVCARGALLLSKARLFDAVPLWRVIDWEEGDSPLSRTDTTELLADTFDRLTLNRIESAFERTQCYSDHSDTPGAAASAVKFGFRFTLADERCKAVMENIVANDGEFLP